ATGLEGFDAQSHGQVVQRFTTAAGDLRRAMTTVIPAEVLSARPFNASNGRGQVGELQRELAKQRRGMGVRALMHKYGELITQVMPCVLVSPDSVARFFQVGGQRFDLVVFDEASQIRVSDAIGAMGRANAVVVVGDSKQMPPTSFAETKVESEEESGAEDRELVEDEESILTEAVQARVPRQWLTWHYRSKDESLIAFSNAHYYDSKLSTFPGPTHAVSDRLASGVGVSLVRVDGTFRRSGAGKLLRTNPEEAAAIFAEISSRFDQSPDHAPSLGVVTFNQQQRAYIEALIRDSQNERMIEALDGSNGEGLFVKNLENVQGDERDVIFFSTAFSVNDKGVLPLNFGPLTRAGGERRLNVAVTRARKQVVVFSSFDPSQLRVEQTQSEGIRHLRAYLELAAYGTGALDGSARKPSLPDRHRDEIAERLRQRGLVVKTGVGLSDFRVDLTLADPRDPEQPLVAVLLDGPGWAARRTVGDRDGLPVQVLSHLMRWPAVERVWMPSWVTDPETVVNDLLSVVMGAKTGLKDPQPPVVTAALHLSPTETEGAGLSASMVMLKERGATAAAPPARLLEGEEPFDPYLPRWRGPRAVLDDLPSRTAANQVRAIAEEVILQEGPVHLERVARLTAASFELTRLTTGRIGAIVQTIPATFRRDANEPFAWPLNLDPEKWRGFRSASPENGRPLDHISIREIGNAMAALCRGAAGMEDQELAAETLIIFGFKRRTAAIGAQLDAAREFALARGVLRRSPSGRVEAGLF
ncbi:MAG: AAA domain-containing protein, partial [Myxococcales bacterium]